MTDPVDAELYIGDVKVDEYADCTVQAYCEAQYALTDSQSLKTLLADLLEYGAAAQAYAQYRLDDLANDSAICTDATAYDAQSVESVRAFTQTTYEGLYFKSVALRLGYDVKLVYKVANASAEGAKVRILTSADGINFTEREVVDLADATKTGNYYEVVISAIKASEFAKIFKAELIDGEDVVQTLTYSVDSYVARFSADSSDTLATLVKMAHNYGASAKAYVNGAIDTPSDPLNE